MPAKTITDLPNDVLVCITKSGNSMTIEAVNSEREVFTAENGDVLFQMLLHRYQEPDTGKLIWQDTSVAAVHGFGPFVWDIGIEISCVAGMMGLFTGTGLNEESTPLWQFYVDHREDVLKTRFREDHPWCRTNSPPVIDPKFPYILSKEPTIINALRAANRLIVVNADQSIG